MSVRKILRRPLRKVSSGDLRAEVQIALKAIQAPNSASVAPDMAFQNIPLTWAKVVTTGRKELFAGTQLLGIKTHDITIRFPDQEITSDHVVFWKGEIYDVLNTQNYEERDEYLILYCGEKGPEEFPSNF